LEIGQMRTNGAVLFHIHDGKVMRLVIYWDRDRALADLGLEEQAMPDKSTTPGLVELVQRWIDARNAGNIDAAMNLCASDIVFEGLFETFEGRAAVRGFFQDWLDTYDELEVAVEEMRDLGNGVTFGVCTQRGRPRGTAGWVRVRYGVVTTWEDELLRRNTSSLDVEQARADAERLAQERG
jgi:ketosteroid isomerase-like protein